MSTLIGIDLQSIDEVEVSLNTFGERYTRRLFTEHEIEVCSGVDNRSHHFAARFAAKEAVMKVLNVRDLNPPWTTIEVRDGVVGVPSISLSGVAAELARRAGIGELSLSMSHDGGVAVATVIAETSHTTNGATSE